MKILSALTLLLLSLALGLACASSPPVNMTRLTGPCGTSWVFVVNPPMNRTAAINACCFLGGRLADLVASPDYSYLASAVNKTVWINSWNGDNYQGAPLAFYPGGAIAVPVGGADAMQGALCDL